MMRSKLRALYYAQVMDLLRHPEVLSMDGFIQHGTTTCLSHCLAVSYIGFCVCRFLGFNARAAARGGLLHDFYLYDWHTPHEDVGLHGFTHPETALRNARSRFALSPVEADVIEKHMWPLTVTRLPRYRETVVILTADKLCALRETLSRFGKRK